MFKDSGINLSIENVKQIFDIVDEDNSKTLTEDEFKKFIFNKESK